MFKIFDGLFWSEPAYVTVTIEPVNDHSPELTLTPLGDAYVEGAAEGAAEGVQLLSDVILTDRDHNNRLTSLHVSNNR